MKLTSILFLCLICSPASASLPILQSATLLGGAQDDKLMCGTFSPSGEIWVAGYGTSTSLAGETMTVFGPDTKSGEATAFIGHLSADGSTVLHALRFGWATVYPADLLVDGDHLYFLGYASNAFLPHIDGDAFDSAVATDAFVMPWNGYYPTYKPVLMRFSASTLALESASWLGGEGVIINTAAGKYWGYVRDRQQMAFAPNGDLIVVSDGGGVYNSGVDYVNRFAANDLSQVIYRSEVSPIGNNGTISTNDHGDTRCNDVAVDGAADAIYVIGYASGDTGYEPYKDPFLFKYRLSDGNQLWPRGGSQGGPNAYWDIRQNKVRPLQADSTGSSVAVAPDGQILAAAFTDGGNTWLTKDPVTLSGTDLPDTIMDGDGFWGFGGASTVSVTGKLRADGTGWVRGHRIKPYPAGNFSNRILGIASNFESHGYAVGFGRDIPMVNSWTGASAWALLMKLDFDPSGTVREMVTHFPGVGSLDNISANTERSRFLVVGQTETSILASTPLLNAAQTSLAGGRDGYVLVFSEEPLETPVLRATGALGETITLQWTGQASVTYEVRASPTLSTAPESWSLIDTIPGVDGEISRFYSLEGESRRFWVVIAVP